MNREKWILFLVIVNSVSFCHSQCLPKFPYQSGWLGADNALSIKLSEDEILWIFSDTFIGPGKSVDRQGSKIIANSAAISTCKNNSPEIRYFWRSENINDPQPIFKSPNARNKYWPTEVFEANNTLYVVLHEVAPKPENSYDLFNFTLKATVVAEVRDFRENTPDNWDVSYVTWPDVFDPNDWNGAMTIEGNYLYVFVGRLRKEYNLLRVLKSELASPLVSLEYYTREGTWSHGFDRNNAHVLIKGAAGGSVVYHQKERKWIMIYGPEFLSNEIHVRCAQSITGPWSTPRLIYNVPEVTPGEQNYSKTNFSYGAREHACYTDEVNGRTLVTYDCNSSDFSTLVNIMEIYTPRVIQFDTGTLCP